MADTNVFAGGWAVTVLNALATGASITPPTNRYLALLKSTVPTDDTGTLTEFTAYSSATRPAITFGTASVTGGNDYQSVSSNASVSFTMTGSDTITGIAITTSNTKGNTLGTGSGGDVIWFGTLTSSIPVSTSNVLTFSSGQITIRLG